MCYMDNSTHIRAAVLAAVLKVLGLGPLGRGQTQARRHNPNTIPTQSPRVFPMRKEDRNAHDSQRSRQDRTTHEEIPGLQPRGAIPGGNGFLRRLPVLVGRRLCGAEAPSAAAWLCSGGDVAGGAAEQSGSSAEGNVPEGNVPEGSVPRAAPQNRATLHCAEGQCALGGLVAPSAGAPPC